MSKKSKSSKSLKGKVLRILACICMIPVFIIPFLNMFTIHTATKIGNSVTYTNSDPIKIFADWSNLDKINTAILTIASVLLVILCIVGVVYLTLAVFSFVKPKAKMISKIMFFVGVAIAVLAIACTILFLVTPLATQYVTDIYVSTTTTNVLVTGTVYMIFAGIVSGVCAVLAEKAK